MNADFFEQIERLLPNAYIAFSIAFTGYEISVYDNGYTEGPPAYFLHSIDTGDLPAALDELIAQITAAWPDKTSAEGILKQIDKLWPWLLVGCYYMGDDYWESEAVCKSWDKTQAHAVARCGGSTMQESLSKLYSALHKRHAEQPL